MFLLFKSGLILDFYEILYMVSILVICHWPGSHT